VALDLPTGRRGRLLALGITLVLLGALWFGVAAPLLGWYADRAVELENRRAVARRMAALAETLPELRLQAQSVAAAAAPGRTGVEDTLEGTSDAIAGAVLQQRLQEMAARAGAPLSSAEALPGEPAGAYRRIGVRVSLSTHWPALVRLLQAVAQAGSPRMLVDDLQLRSSPILLRAGPRPMEASFTVIAFRSGAAQTAAGGQGTAGPGAAR
jgi:general secretion pathway protein M